MTHGAPAAADVRVTHASTTHSPSLYVNEELQRRVNERVTVAVVGAGFLGRCIALDLSMLGVNVLLYDKNPQVASALSAFAYEQLNPMLHLGYVTKSMLTRACHHVRVVSDLHECANASLIIEAIPDDLGAKIELFRALERVCSSSTPLATSTITFSVESIQQQLSHQERFLGVRFFHPCVLVSPVEVSVGPATAQCAVTSVVQLLRSIQKIPHRGPTKRVLSNREVSAFQFNTAVRGHFYHGLLEPKAHSLSDIITPADGPPLVDESEELRGSTTAL
ncbi:hypothetical protein Poli38472_007860 [Pythium oligandrum]|uniref:3-hydroxyacyl-CoA dehydrogenase NAD binding domain-containing protein n=1 Tax=Pythium oligandrum TaxID=41045 RepID=A0A8K1FS40_PYTOL|nr:hypothetical protein Poli38472_007860 [Pythium oligandrum]|eukprot:TMW68188.1 hypothetical protein Poli38472_007860 [Pythium oligandrum]